MKWSPADVDEGCDSVLSQSLPRFQTAGLHAQVCFNLEYGVTEKWPHTGCCAPAASSMDRSCDEMGLVTEQSPDHTDYLLMWAMVKILQENWDLVRWAACLTQSWSPQLDIRFPGAVSVPLQDMLDYLFTPDEHGRSRLWIATVGRARNPRYGQHPDEPEFDGAAMWAKTMARPASDGSFGVIIPIAHRWWLEARELWTRGGEHRFCAATQMASLFLHEMVHIVGDGFGARHDETNLVEDETGALVSWACWEETTMTGSVFRWAMAKRYPCLAETSCYGNTDSRNFARSDGNLRKAIWKTPPLDVNDGRPGL